MTLIKVFIHHRVIDSQSFVARIASHFHALTRDTREVSAEHRYKRYTSVCCVQKMCTCQRQLHGTASQLPSLRTARHASIYSITQSRQPSPPGPCTQAAGRSGESVVQPVDQSYDTLPYRVIPVGVELSCKPCHVPMLQPVISTAHYGVRPTTSGHPVNIVILMMTHIIKWGRGRRLLHRAMLPT